MKGNKLTNLSFSLSLTMWFAVGCQQPQDEKLPSKADTINELIEASLFQELRGARALVIIPNAGCDGCISSAESFIIQNLSNYPNLFIAFTSIGSEKGLRIRTGSDIFNHERTIIDNQNYFYQDSLKSVYPQVVYLDTGIVIRIVEVSPFSPNAIDSLQKFLGR
ncbi:hypothetical protein ACV07N_01905 [Roseivirga echinicomitans]